jgi:hypothetical protein
MGQEGGVVKRHCGCELKSAIVLNPLASMSRHGAEVAELVQSFVGLLVGVLGGIGTLKKVFVPTIFVRDNVSVGRGVVVHGAPQPTRLLVLLGVGAVKVTCPPVEEAEQLAPDSTVPVKDDVGLTS